MNKIWIGLVLTIAVSSNALALDISTPRLKESVYIFSSGSTPLANNSSTSLRAAISYAPNQDVVMSGYTNIIYQGGVQSRRIGISSLSNVARLSSNIYCDALGSVDFGTGDMLEFSLAGQIRQELSQDTLVSYLVGLNGATSSSRPVGFDASATVSQLLNQDVELLCGIDMAMGGIYTDTQLQAMVGSNLLLSERLEFQLDATAPLMNAGTTWGLSFGVFAQMM